MRWRQFNRRHLLLATLGIGILTRSIREELRRKKILSLNESVETLSEVTLGEKASILESAYTSEKQWQELVKEIKAIANSVAPTSPTIPYNPEMSKLLIRCCKLAVQQFNTGSKNPDYQGEITSLPEYSEDFEKYKQIINFTSEQDIIEDVFDLNFQPTPGWTLTPLGKKIRALREVVEESLPTLIQGFHRRSVYFGFVLTSQEENIIVFRGTQTKAEWVNNLNSIQENYINPINNQSYGWVHQGFLNMATKMINPLPSTIVQQLDPSIPCYITGHSLGAAIATVAAFDIALKHPQLSKQIQLYTYAGPRVGDPIFVKKYNQLLPNSYRVVNLADTVPLVPSLRMGKHYLHVGQEWSFLNQFGELLLNHVVDTYREAIEQELVIKL
ncbi:lipase family protein [Cyanothece sp. BG0011]|uniref:lipase family protein n=1 Tax=Cyanothece sp. BG0011 TaxID=2082950 RepID=UPI000D1E4B50|nr:lipase family protein [Cyanothece sp. BG0011]